jgi:signal transduction histidine kinase
MSGGDKKLEEAAHDEVVNHFFHDFHGEISTILMCVAAVRDGVGGGVGDEQRKCLERAIDNCDHMVRLINNYRDRMQLEAGTFPCEPEVVPLQRVWDNLRASLARAAERRGVRFALDAPVVASVRFRAPLFERAMENLLRQTVENTRLGGLASCEVRREGPQLLVRASFEGQDIEPSLAQTVFDPVQQARVGLRLGRGYTLLFCKHALACLGGELRLSVRQNHGGELWARIPFEEAGNDEPGNATR